MRKPKMPKSGPKSGVENDLFAGQIMPIPVKRFNPLDFKTPDWIDRELWETFLEVRQKKKAVNSERALKTLVNRMRGLMLEGNDPTEMLELSITNSWQSVYPVRKRFAGKKTAVTETTNDNWYKGGI